MTTKYVSENRLSTLLIVLFLSIWLTYLWREIFLTPIQGVDSIIRLFDIELLFPKNHWPPLPQIFLQAVSIISDTALSYKIASTVIALIAMYSIFRLVEELFGIASASFVMIFFFLHWGWMFVATNPYPETFMFLFLAQTLRTLLHNKHTAASLFFILACLSRLEVLFFAPFLLYKLKTSQAPRRASIILFFFIVPLICFFTLRAYLSSSSELHSADISSFHVSMTLTKVLFANFLKRPEWIFFGALALVGTTSLLFTRNARYRSGTMLAMTSLIIFFLCYIFITPLFHSYLPTGNTRKTMIVLFPVCIFASSLFSLTSQRGQQTLSIAILLTVAVWGYQSDQNKKLKGFFTKPKSTTTWIRQFVPNNEIEICIPHKYKTAIENYFFILNEDMKRDMYLQLRFSGISITKRDCAQRNTIPSKKILPLLLILGKHEVLYQEIKKSCKLQKSIYLQQKESGIACVL